MSIQTYPVADVVPAPVEARGAEDFDYRVYASQAEAGLKEQGISPRRLPAWTRLQLPQVMDVIVRMPSGVRLRFNTSSTRVGLSFLATNLVNPGKERRNISFNLEMPSEPGADIAHSSSALGNAIHLDPSKPEKYELVRGQPDTLWFESLPAGDKCCELWLPHNAFIELRSLHLDKGATLNSSDEDPRPRWLHYGSSISHCMEAEQPALTWPAVAARLAGANLQSFGFGGQCHLDQFVARSIRDSEADVISLKVGINIINMDSMRERVFVSALHGFLDTVREGKPATPLVLISPIYCPSAEKSPGPTFPDADGKYITVAGDEKLRQGCMTLQRTRTLISEVVQQRHAAGDKRLSYLDGLDLFGFEDKNDLPDDLHPNPEGYIRMGERFSPILKKLLS